MGFGQSKNQNQEQEAQNVAFAQAIAGSTHVDNKLNYFGIVLIVIVVLLAIIFCYGIRLQCQKKVRNWLRKGAVGVGLSPPVIQVQAARPATAAQQPVQPTAVY